jgi:hypothetical protein
VALDDEGDRHMPISQHGVPDEAFELVHAIMSSRASASTFGLGRLADADPRALSVAMPHRVELLDLRDVRRGTVRKSRRATARDRKRGQCWRFLVLRELADRANQGGGADSGGCEAIAAATVVRAKANKFAKTDELHFGGLNQGPLVAGTEQAIREAEAWSEVSKGQFEAVLLVVPARYVTALWLQHVSNDPTGEADLVIPIVPSNPALKLAGPTPLPVFLEALRQLP